MAMDSFSALAVNLVLGQEEKEEAMHICVQCKENKLFCENKPVASTEKGQNESLVGIFSSILQNCHEFWPCKSLWPPSLSQTADIVLIDSSHTHTASQKQNTIKCIQNMT